MKAKMWKFSRRNTIVLSIILIAVLLTISTVGILFVRWCLGPVLILGHGVIAPIQESFAQRRLLCDTDHEALLEECRKLSKQIASEDANTGLSVAITEVPASKLSGFPTIQKVGGRAIVDSKGGASIELGGTWRHFGVLAYHEDSAKPSSSSHSFPENRELVPGLWYYDDLYNRDKNYDKVVEKLLRKNKTRKIE